MMTQMIKGGPAIREIAINKSEIRKNKTCHDLSLVAFQAKGENTKTRNYTKTKETNTKGMENLKDNGKWAKTSKDHKDN